jgi:heme A synthase
LWLNFTFNQYMIQLVHRLLSIGLWSALVANVACSRRRNHDALGWGAVLLIIATADMGAGIATLWLGAPAVASVVHEVGAIALLAGAFAAMPLR